MNKTYQYLLFDADDTLFDFKASEQEALNSFFQSLNLELTDSLRNHYHEINHSLWAAFERGAITKEEILNTRFRKLFREEGIKVDHPTLEKDYQDRLASSYLTIPGVFEMLDTLKEHYDLYIVSNGVASTQYSRLKASGLYSYFKDIFISEETGFQKPQIEFFQYVFQRIPAFDSSKAIIIGDSLGSDMQGGVNAGIDTCWYNPKHQENTRNLPITYVVDSFDSIRSILL